MSLSKYESQILKTGFALEHSVSKALRKQGWTVISNKYYIDDSEETVREIDLLAYKARTVQHFKVYTALIISCKKNEANSWAFLSRELDRHDPNRDWHPFHAWTNDKALSYQIAQKGFPAQYHKRATKNGGLIAIEEPEVDVFAFQEMNKQSGAAQNDKAIFASITSLMKAQSYELNALPTRKTDPCVYHFSLLSVVDADLIRIKFGDAEPKATEIDSDTYIASYIINKKEEFSRIRFLKAKNIETQIKEYNALHSFNCETFSDACNDFYDGVVKDWTRTEVFIELFTKTVAGSLYWRIYKKFSERIEIKDIYLYWRNDEKGVAICLPLSEKHLSFLNQDSEAKILTASALKKIYRYEGAFEFEEESVPF